jgi:hypothetical protein
MLPAALSADRIKRLLPPTAAARIHLIDKGGRRWDAVKQYIKPVAVDVMRDGGPPPPPTRTPESLCRELAAHAYSISLSLAQGSAAIVPPVPMLDLINELEPLAADPEAKARLAMIRGVATNFAHREDMPALVCLPHATEKLSDRIDEILEDAYLLEASKLRTFFAPGANWAALRRDLRKILSWVVRNRSWATGMFRVGQQTLAVPTQADAVAEALVNMGGSAGQKNSPVLLLDTHAQWTGPDTVVQVKYPGGLGVFLPSLRR